MRLGVEALVAGGEIVSGDVEVADGRVARVGLPGRGRGYAVPPFVDLQVNGWGGVDLLTEPERAGEIDAGLAREGVLAWQPTLITAPLDRTLAALAALPGDLPLGAHLEGPFLSPRFPGAHAVEHLRAPDPELLRALLDGGRVSMVTLAPELPGGLDLVDECVRRGVRVSLGHSDATADEARAGFAHGAASVTHLFNAMRPFRHRDPGLAGAALTGSAHVMLIVDGVHLAPESVALAFAAAGERCAVVTDAIAAAAMGDGTYRMGDVEVHVRDGASRRADGVIAGGVGSMAGALRRLADAGVPLPLAVRAVSEAPAELAGVEELVHLHEGGPATLVVLDDGLEVVRVLHDGRPPDICGALT